MAYGSNREDFAANRASHRMARSSGSHVDQYRLDPEAVLNGIAYDAAANRLFVTGKLWPRLFEIR